PNATRNCTLRVNSGRSVKVPSEIPFSVACTLPAPAGVTVNVSWPLVPPTARLLSWSWATAAAFADAASWRVSWPAPPRHGPPPPRSRLHLFLSLLHPLLADRLAQAWQMRRAVRLLQQLLHILTGVLDRRRLAGLPNRFLHRPRTVSLRPQPQLQF